MFSTLVLPSQWTGGFGRASADVGDMASMSQTVGRGQRADEHL